MAAHRKEPNVRLVGDNIAALWSLERMKAGVGHRVQNRILRRVMHTLRWSGQRIQLGWVGSKDNLADPISRFGEFSTSWKACLEGCRLGWITEELFEERVTTWGRIRYRG